MRYLRDILNAGIFLFCFLNQFKTAVGERSVFMMTEIQRWLNSSVVDSATKELLSRMTEEEASYAFNGYMEFGTAGLRAKMAPGTANMNLYTVAHATAGMAKLILSKGDAAAERGVVIAFDSRHNSEAFSRRAAQVLSAYGIKVYIFPSLRPTPVLSFSIRELGCIAGINITASHNPKEYNGYKAYWEDGAQISPEQAASVSASISSIDILDGVPSPEEAQDRLILPVPAEIDEKYIENVLNERVNPDAIPSAGDSFSIVYTPLHGAGMVMVPEVLKRAGLKNLYVVSKQADPDGDFPTVKFPNPEFPEAFELGIPIAEKIGSQLIVATDPDSDRVGVMARDSSGVFRCISGNQMGALLLDYIITAYKTRGTMPDEPYAVKTIVTSSLAEEICRRNGVKMYDVLTGFKYIGEVIKNHLREGRGTFLLGFEESYGYLKGTYARDKDAVVASMLICEMAAYYSTKGMTLCDALESLFKKYGYYMEKTDNFYFDTPDGHERMSAITSRLRKNPPKELAGLPITQFRDYKTGLITDAGTGDSRPTGLPVSDILYYVTDRCVSVIRPSGTEPKLKIYLMAKGKNKDSAKAAVEAHEKALRALLGTDA